MRTKTIAHQTTTSLNSPPTNPILPRPQKFLHVANAWKPCLARLPLSPTSPPPPPHPPTAKEMGKTGKTVPIGTSRPAAPLPSLWKPSTLAIREPIADATTRKATSTSSDLVIKRKVVGQPEDERRAKKLYLGVECFPYDCIARGAWGNLNDFCWANCSAPPADIRALEKLPLFDLLESNPLFTYKVRLFILHSSLTTSSITTE